MKALIIEPSDAYRQLLVKVVQDFGFRTVGVSGYSDACDELDRHNFTVICMAMNLADGNSHDLCLKLRNNDNTATVPLLMLTSLQSDKTTQQVIALGVTEVFNKQDFNAFTQYLSHLVKRLTKPSTITGNILYIEDSESMALLISKQLRHQGYSVEHHASAMPALNAFDKKDFDLVLTDIILEGGIGGTQIVRSIRQNTDECKRCTPILATSGYDDNARKLELFHLGISDYIPKPVIEEELLARVNNLISNRKLILKLEMQQKQLATLAMTDQLTGLYNRHYFMDIAAKKIAQAKRRGHPLCLLVIDIDHFKAINDTHGHAQGDDVLTAFAQLLAANIRSEDVIARYGGEEFILMMEHCDTRAAQKKANELRLLIAHLCPNDITITASFGISSLLPEDGFSELFVRADEALYQAKENGRNQVALHS